MAKAIIIYGSSTGNTETVAESIETGLKSKGIEVDVVDVDSSSVEEAINYDLIVLGASTWGDGEIQDDFLNFYDAIDERFSGKKVAVFGCGDSIMFPDYFCEAVDLIEKKVREQGAQIISKSFKVDGDIDEFLHEAEEWGAGLI